MAASRNFEKILLIAIFTANLFILVEDANTSSCKIVLKRIESCWDLFTKVPEANPFGNKTYRDLPDSMHKCCMKHLYDLQNCTFQQTWEGAHRTELFAKAMIIIFENKVLQEEFANDDDCWADAHSCARHIVLLPKQPTTELCLNVTAKVNECKSAEHNILRRGNCTENIQTFINKLLDQQEVCGVGTIFGHALLVLVAVFTSFFSR